MGWKSRKVGSNRAAIGSPVGGRGGSRGGGERVEGARPGDPRGVGVEATSTAAVGQLFWALPPAGADSVGRETQLCPREATGLEWSFPISPAS